jgi:protein transport protein SEC61 subunit gamma-like protein
MAKLSEKIKEFYFKCKRVWKALKKPTKEEFRTIAKISAIGILIIGLFGFLISLLINLFF